PKNQTLSLPVGPSRSACPSQNNRFGLLPCAVPRLLFGHVNPRAAMSDAAALLPTKLPGSYVRCSSPLNWFPPLLIVVTIAAPPEFISTSLPSAPTDTSSLAK